MPLPAGTRIARYEILATLGAGGMGEVYAARDLQLDRRVALKILPADCTRAPERVRRFVQEAKAASALNHPGIVTVFEIGDADGIPFIATELIEGQTLRERMRAGAVPIAETIDVAIQAASALAAAHEAGVIHRDLKPDNLMVRRDGYVKIVDFGLAKLRAAEASAAATAAPTAADLTQAGAVFGTVRYMSPEQARGLALDERSDLFSLGAVLYEMVAGRSPFDAPTTSDVIAAILEREPAGLDGIRSGVPVELQRLVTKALRKEPDERYQTARDLLADLKNLKVQRAAGRQPRRWSVPPMARDRRLMVPLALAALIAASVVMLLPTARPPALTERDTILLADFVNATGEPDFDGGTLKQALMAQLRQTPFLNLLPEEAVRQTLRYMERPADTRVTRELGREIVARQGLSAMIVGTIASIGRNYVVTLEAVSGATGEILASAQVEADAKEGVLMALGQAATSLRRELGESLSTLERFNVRVEQATTSSLEALKLYSAAFDQFIVAGDARGSIPLLVRTIEVDPDFAIALDTLAWAYVNVGSFREATASASKAFSLREGVSEIERYYITDTYHHWVTGDWEKQNAASELAKRLYPQDWGPPHSLAINYTGMGRDAQAVAEARDAIRLNPNVVHPYRFLAIALMHLNRLEEAKAVIQQTQARGMDGPFFRQTLYQIAFLQDDRTALAQQLELMRTHDGPPTAALWSARTAGREGRWHDAQASYRQVTEISAGGGAPLPLEALGTAAGLGWCDAAQATARALTSSRIVSAGVSLAVPIQSDGSLCGNAIQGAALADALAGRYPDSTLANTSARVVHAAVALQQDRPEAALEILSRRDAGRYDATYLRGQALLRLERGSDALAEFDSILQQPGLDPLSTVYPLAQLGRARALAVAGDRAGSRTAYRAFLDAWRTADPDVPVLVEARAEYTRLD